jgi:hypothetical protein
MRETQGEIPWVYSPKLIHQQSQQRSQAFCLAQNRRSDPRLHRSLLCANFRDRTLDAKAKVVHLCTHRCPKSSHGNSENWLCANFPTSVGESYGGCPIGPRNGRDAHHGPVVNVALSSRRLFWTSQNLVQPIATKIQSFLKSANESGDDLSTHIARKRCIGFTAAESKEAGGRAISSRPEVAIKDS